MYLDYIPEICDIEVEYGTNENQYFYDIVSSLVGRFVGRPLNYRRATVCNNKHEVLWLMK